MEVLAGKRIPFKSWEIAALIFLSVLLAARFEILGLLLVLVIVVSLYLRRSTGKGE